MAFAPRARMAVQRRSGSRSAPAARIDQSPDRHAEQHIGSDKSRPLKQTDLRIAKTQILLYGPYEQIEDLSIDKRKDKDQRQQRGNPPGPSGTGIAVPGVCLCEHEAVIWL